MKKLTALSVLVVFFLMFCFWRGFAQKDDCLFCHKEKSLVKTDQGGKEISLYIDKSMVDSSIHRQLRCVECHRVVKDELHMEKPGPSVHLRGDLSAPDINDHLCGFDSEWICLKVSQRLVGFLDGSLRGGGDLPQSNPQDSGSNICSALFLQSLVSFFTDRGRRQCKEYEELKEKGKIVDFEEME